MTVRTWRIEELCGYKPKTTFYEDFSIADAFGISAIKDTYKRAFNSWKDDVEYLTELVMVLNWKIFEHYETNDDYAKEYNKLWQQTDEYAYKTLKDDNLRYYLNTID